MGNALSISKRPIWLSVLIPTYNGSKYLPRALDSILLQGDLNVECIAVDDGSTDNTLSILNEYKQKLRFRIIQRKRQGNWVASTNYALSIAKGEYVCFLHQDDIWLENRLVVMRQMINQFPEVNLYLHSSSFINSNGDILGEWCCPLPSYPEIVTSSLLMERLLIQNFISIPAPIFKREIAISVGGMDETLWYTADWDFWLKIASCSKALYCPQALSGFRIQPTSQTVVRSSYLADFRSQLENVIQKHLSFWDESDKKKNGLLKIANFSIRVNVALARLYHRNKINLASLLLAFFVLGPRGWIQYLRDSRIWERLSARLRARIVSRN